MSLLAPKHHRSEDPKHLSIALGVETTCPAYLYQGNSLGIDSRGTGLAALLDYSSGSLPTLFYTTVPRNPIKVLLRTVHATLSDVGLGVLAPLVHQAAPTTFRTQTTIPRLAVVPTRSLELLLGLLVLLRLLAHLRSFLDSVELPKVTTKDTTKDSN